MTRHARSRASQHVGAGPCRDRANKGKTWEQATPTYSVDYFSEGSLEYAFAPAVADGTGHLVRACVRVNAGKKCTAAW
jgi:hypothetical protein